MKMLVWLAAIMLAVPATASADLIIRVTSEDSTNAVLDQHTSTLVLPSPMPSLSSLTLATGLTGGFDVTVSTNVSTVTPASVAHSLTINLSYSGPTGGLSNHLIVEFLGTNYGSPVSPPPVFIMSNGSPSTSGLQANLVTMISGVSVTNNTSLPGTPGSGSGFSLGQTLGTGTMGLGAASSLLNPNPANGAVFSQTGSLFSFYQAFDFDQFLNSGAGSISAGSFLGPVVPAPAGFVTAGIGLVGFGGLAAWRKLKNAKASLVSC